MKYKRLAWIRDPQGGREDSPCGRFVLWGPTDFVRCYTLEDTETEKSYECRTLQDVRRTVLEILSDDVKRPLSAEDEAEILEFLQKFDEKGDDS